MPLQPIQRAYLDALGIEVWERRMHRSAQAPVAEAAALEVAQAAPLAVAEPAPAEVPGSTVPDPIESMDWEALERAVASCTRCALHATRTRAVFGVGSRSADWLFVGEAPGADEDRQGEPFVGRAGQLLNAMIEALGLKREAVYIANVLKSRPPGNRDPQPQEVTACEPFLVRQIALLRPRLIVALGRHAAHSLLKTDLPLARLRGQQLSYQGTPLVVTFHPAYLLRNPADKRRAWDDLCRARRIVEAAA